MGLYFQWKLSNIQLIDGRLNGESRLSRSSSNPVAQHITVGATPLSLRRTIRYQQDGAPPHNAGTVSNFLNIMFPNRWIGNTGPIQWPRRSPDPNPLDFNFGAK